MQARYDIRFTKDYINANNDVEWFASDVAHIHSIISANPGEFKETPTLGVGIGKYLNASGIDAEIKRSVMMNLQNDGYPCDNPIIQTDVNNKLTVNPNM